MKLFVLLFVLLFVFCIKISYCCNLIITYDTSLSVRYAKHLSSKEKLITMIKQLQYKNTTFTLINWSTRSYLLFNQTNNLNNMKSIIRNMTYLGMGERIDRLIHLVNMFNGIIVSISDKIINLNREQIHICNGDICNNMLLFHQIDNIRNKTCGNNKVIFNINKINNNQYNININTKYSGDYNISVYKNNYIINNTIMYIDKMNNYILYVMNYGIYKVCIDLYCSENILIKKENELISTTTIIVSAVLGATIVTGGSIDNSIQMGQFISATSSLNTYQDKSFSDSMSITNFGVGENIYQVLYTNNTKQNEYYKLVK